MSKECNRQKFLPALFLYFFLFFICCLVVPAVVYSAGLKPDKNYPWNIIADQISYQEDLGIYTAEGEVIISQPGRKLKADKAVYEEGSGLFHVYGNVHFDVGGDVLTGEEGVFDFDSRTGTFDNGNLFIKKNNMHINADETKKIGDETYVMTNCTITTCDGENPDWSIGGSEIKVTVEGYGTVKNAVFKIKGVPVLYVPWLIFPAKTNRQSGFLTPILGSSSRVGADMELPFFWAISDQTDATLYQRYMTKRGYMQGAEFRYLNDENSKGIFALDILSDKISAKDMRDKEALKLSPYERTNSTRYWFRGKMDQELPFDTTFRLDADYVSDQDYLREFKFSSFLKSRTDFKDWWNRPSDDIYAPYRKTAWRLSHDKSNYSLQLHGTYFQKPELHAYNDNTAQPFAGMTFGNVQQRIPGTPVYFTMDANYDYVWREPVSAGISDKGHMLDITQSVDAPIKLGKSFIFKPFASYTWLRQWYDTGPSPSTGSGSDTKGLYTFGAELSTTIEKDYKTNLFGASSVKHRILPKISYTMSRHKDMDKYRPWYETIDSIESDGRVNELAFSLENFLNAKTIGENNTFSYRQWLKFVLTQRIDLEEARRNEILGGKEKKPLLPLRASMRLRPSQVISLSGSLYWDHYESEITAASASLSLKLPRSGKRYDSIGLDYYNSRNYLDRINNVYENMSDLRLRAEINVWENYILGGNFSLNLRGGEGNNTLSSIWLQYASQCWAIKTSVDWGDRDVGFAIRFVLNGFGSNSLF